MNSDKFKMQILFQFKFLNKEMIVLNFCDWFYLQREI